MVMEEMKNPRPTYVYNRGSYTEPIYTVEPKVPDILPQMNSDLPKSRLGLSQWLFDKKSIDGESCGESLLANDLWKWTSEYSK